ncbi:hypothetical protein BCR32DRAFT_324414 [Anaeromyces robustus]|uniref:Calcium-dependent phosphotriesterase n=1 Tax=Anaeromyces robustus TaxID=1754192 RepID=A0A1Y1XPC5_9FUNG|nr:hypothetical protein BCR32DRAFT_324414 [Anaeromyces robustus]|eukprot:ORX87599.1 hypothetical protein BCR32DRAFT_324414 [Anaeromyces robustus]
MAISILKSIGLTSTAISVILVSFLYLPFSFLIKKGGLFKDTFPINTKLQLSCKPIKDLPIQCNDFVIHEPSLTSIYTGAQNNLITFFNDNEVKYLLPYVYNIETKIAEKLKIIDFPENKEMKFKTVKLYDSKELQKSFLFFINENENGNTIEKFEYQPKNHAAIWKKTIDNKLIQYASDFVLVNENEALVINKYNTNNKWMQLVENIFTRSKSKVVSCDENSKCDVLADSIKGAGGIEISRDASTVFVSSSYTGKILVFERREINNSLRLSYTQDLDFIPGRLFFISSENENVYALGYRSVLGLFIRIFNSYIKKYIKSDFSIQAPLVLGKMVKNEDRDKFYGVLFKWKSVIEMDGELSNDNNINDRDISSLSIIRNDKTRKQSFALSWNENTRPLVCNAIN